MHSARVPFRNTGYFSDLICDYWEGDPALCPFYNLPPNWDSFALQMEQKAEAYSSRQRELLVEALNQQYRGLDDVSRVKTAIHSLKEEHAFTVVTGHQLNLFTGPLYFLYKILACINTAEELGRRYPDRIFVPVYWMATEDHDFDEINFFRNGELKLSWERKAGGAVGRLDTSGLEEVARVFDQQLGKGSNSEELRELFRKAYLGSESLGEAHRKLVHELFGSYGLVCIDGDDPKLKHMAGDLFSRDIREGISFRNATADSKTLSSLRVGYKSQAFPRDVNFFYLTGSQRRRFVHQRHYYELSEGSETWTAKELLNEISTQPERFSPNVIMRPLYQECILPNLAYIGGGGELAYWLQLRGTFGEHRIPMPILLLRPSLLLLESKIADKLERLGIVPSDLFLGENEWINRRIRQISNIDLDFSPLQERLRQQFEYMYELAEQTDPTFLKAVKAQEVRQLKGLEKLEKRLLLAQRRKLSDEVSRLSSLHQMVFPGGSLQERSQNFSVYYRMMGKELIPFLKERLPAIPDEFQIEILPV